MATSRWITREHGAWAFLIVPWAAGVLAPGGSWRQPLVLVAVVSSYLAINAAEPWLRRRGPLPAPVIVYGVVAVAATGWLIATEPGLWRYGVLLLPLAIVVVLSTRAGNARSLPSGIASMTQAALIAPITYDVGTAEPQLEIAWLLLAGCWLFFVGSLLHVKSLIRKRGDLRYRRLSHGYSAAALLAAGLIEPWLLPAFALAAARAWWPGLRGARPPIIGAVEIVASLVLLGCLALATHR